MAEILGALLAVCGGVLMFASSVYLAFLAAKESPLWLIGYIFIPIISLIFVAKFWDKTRKPFGLMCVGVALLVLGNYLGNGGG